MQWRKSKWHSQRYLVTGIVTIIPLWITWWIMAFVFDQLTVISMPAVRTLASRLNGPSDPLVSLLAHPAMQSLVAALLTLVLLYLLGLLASFVIGRRLIALMEGILHRIPLVQTIYGGIRQLMRSLESHPNKPQRVVLIEFRGRNAGGRFRHPDSDRRGNRHRAGRRLCPDHAEPDLRLCPDRAHRPADRDRLERG